MPKLTVSRAISDRDVAKEVEARLLGRRPDIEKELAIQLAAEMVRTGAIKFEYAYDLFDGNKKVCASVVVGEEHIHTYQPEEPKWQP